MNNNHINYKQVYAIKAQNERRILKQNSAVPKRSGIYFLLREENGFKFAYIGQAVNILSRLASHLSGYQHIDLSIRKHGFWSEKNPTGYTVHFLEFPRSELDEKEMYYIRKYANAGYQLRNSTTGSQGEEKKGLDNQKQPRTYTEGKAEGKKQLAREIKKIVDKHLIISLKKDTKISQKALNKFYELLDENNLL